MTRKQFDKLRVGQPIKEKDTGFTSTIVRRGYWVKDERGFSNIAVTPSLWQFVKKKKGGR